MNNNSAALSFLPLDSSQKCCKRVRLCPDGYRLIARRMGRDPDSFPSCLMDELRKNLYSKEIL